MLKTLLSIILLTSVSNASIDLGNLSETYIEVPTLLSFDQNCPNVIENYNVTKTHTINMLQSYGTFTTFFIIESVDGKTIGAAKIKLEKVEGKDLQTKEFEISNPKFCN